MARRLLPALALLLCAGAFAQDADRKALDLGQKTWSTNCAACHFVPTPAVPIDRMWLGMLKTTT